MVKLMVLDSEICIWVALQNKDYAGACKVLLLRGKGHNNWETRLLARIFRHVRPR